MILIRRLIVVALLLAAAPLRADTLLGLVIAVVDGDTLTIRDDSRKQHTVWLAGIDAPKSKQPFAAESRQHLAKLLAGKEVSIEWRSRDDYGRIVGKVTLRAADCSACTPTLDAGLTQLEAGMAWWDRDYRRRQSLEDQGRYEFAEFDARTRRIGLWQDPAAEPPREWRKRHIKSWQASPQHPATLPERST